MYEGDNLQMLESKISFSGSKKCIDSLNMVIEMIVASFVMCEKWFDLMSFQKSHRAGVSIALAVQKFIFSFYIFATEKHVFYSLFKKKKIIRVCFPIKVLGNLHAKLPLALMNYLHKFPFNR